MSMSDLNDRAESVKKLEEAIKKGKELKNRDIWAYTGFLYEDLLCNGKRHFEVTDRLLNCIDILIDGKFIENLKNIDLNFRGSENQRIIDLNKTRKEKKIVLSELNN